MGFTNSAFSLVGDRARGRRWQAFVHIPRGDPCIVLLQQHAVDRHAPSAGSWRTFGCAQVGPGQGYPYEAFVTPTETHDHGVALCVMVKTWGTHKTIETVVNNGWRLPAVGGWWWVAVGGLEVGGGWWSVGSRRLAVGGWSSLGAVLRGCASYEHPWSRLICGWGLGEIWDGTRCVL